ncbi:hypothetical protein I8H84_00280 [Candidatus Saccharibacteria bacterium]|nr:hypothetical protein [Candidatus Saccharibacteria bacterium]MBH1972388.1 hypothetical protein [Candidatus Saccharibacteria bacterium]MBH1990270.1 hypothetical protein [Candidatus Saccharibacteria bacterium]
MNERTTSDEYVQPLELTAVFNGHATRNDADATLELIAPNTIVFREGIIQQNRLSTLEDYIELADTRMQKGRYDDDALSLAGKIRDERRARQGLASKWSSGDYHERLLSGVIEKNCVLFPADFVSFDGDTLPIDDTDWIPADIQRMVRENTPRTIERIVSARSVLTEARIRETALREEAAASRVQEVFGKIAVEKMIDIEPNAYIVYGALHRHSLLRRLAAAGLEVSKVEYTYPSSVIEQLSDLAQLEDTSLDLERDAMRAFMQERLRVTNQP